MDLFHKGVAGVSNTWLCGLRSVTYCSIFDGLGLEQPSRLPMSQAQLRDLHERSIDTGLDVLDDTFRLGIPALRRDGGYNASAERSVRTDGATRRARCA